MEYVFVIVVIFDNGLGELRGIFIWVMFVVMSVLVVGRVLFGEMFCRMVMIFWFMMVFFDRFDR